MASTATSPKFVVNSVGCIDVYQFLSASQREWEDSHKATVVNRNYVPASFGDVISTVVPIDGPDTPTQQAATNVFPIVVIPRLPVASYPQYIRFLYRATVAALHVDSPALAEQMDDTRTNFLVAAVVSARVGVWSAMSTVPAGSQYSAAAVYDAKRKKVFLRSAGKDAAVTAWHTAFRAIPEMTSAVLEICLQFCSVAPTLMSLASSTEYATAGAFGMEYVEESISRCLRDRMTKHAYKAAGLGQALMWDALRQATIGGLPVSVVRAWASDAVVAIGTGRRALTDPRSIEWSRRREAKVKAAAQGQMTPTAAPVLSDDVKDEWSRIREKVASGRLGDDESDTGSVITETTGSETPRPLSPALTIQYDRPDSPMERHTDAEYAALKESVATGLVNAHSNDIYCADVLQDTNADIEFTM